MVLHTCGSFGSDLEPSFGSPRSSRCARAMDSTWLDTPEISSLSSMGNPMSPGHEYRGIEVLKASLPRKTAEYIKETWRSREIRGRISRVMSEEDKALLRTWMHPVLTFCIWIRDSCNQQFQLNIYQKSVSSPSSSVLVYYTIYSIITRRNCSPVLSPPPHNLT